MAEDLALIKAALAVRGDGFEPITFSRATSLAPTSTTKQGDPRPDGRGSFPFSTWTLSIAERSDATDPVVGQLLDLVWPARESIRSFIQAGSAICEVVCTVQIDNDRPALGLGPDTLKRLAELGCPVVFDVYDYS